MIRSKILIALAAAASVVSIAAPASAETGWARHHPRQHQVLHRVHHQQARIRAERHEGKITHAQARALHAETHAIARQEHADARAHGGHITKPEQHQLNRELNAQSGAIGH